MVDTTNAALRELLRRGVASMPELRGVTFDEPVIRFDFEPDESKLHLEPQDE